MTLEDARQIVGAANAQEPYLGNMVRALTLHQWLNTPEENRRLEAAKMLRAAARRVRIR